MRRELDNENPGPGAAVAPGGGAGERRVPQRRSAALVELLGEFANAEVSLGALRQAARADGTAFGAEVLRMLDAEQHRGVRRLRANARSMTTALPTRRPAADPGDR